MAELPLEIITDILIRLPVKSLIRFKCVSKPWKSLISSPNFTHRHLNQTLITNPNPQNLIITHNHTLITAVISARNHLRFAELDHPLKRLPHRPNVGLIESCNGVLFISDYPKETMFLFNPSINSYCLLPKPSPPPASVSGYDEFFGFGYDSLNNDYKVVRLQQWKVDGAGLGRDASVYSLRDDVWKSVKDVTMPYFLQRSHAVAANEMLHFVALTKNYKPVLKCFDLRTNALLIVDYPELESYDFSKMSMSLREVRGHLCLLVSYQNHRGVAMGNPLYNRELKYADLWEMRERGKKESWVKLFRIRKSEIVERCIYLRLVTYSKDERSVLLEVNGKWFGWYDLVSKRIEKVLIQGLGVDDVPYVAMTFVESLVSVSNDKLVLKGGMMPSNDKVVLKGGTTSSNDKAVPNGGTRLPKKNSKKAGFLSSGFKLKL